jgi:hypothetical protein
MRTAFYSVLLAGLATPLQGQDYTSASAPVRLDSYEGALVTGAYWAGDGVRVETWCERRPVGPGKVIRTATEHWTFSKRDDAPKARHPNPEHMVNLKFTLEPLPEPTQVTCYYRNVDTRPAQKSRIYYPWGNEEWRSGYVIHRRYFQQPGAGDPAPFQYRFYVARKPPADIP